MVHLIDNTVELAHLVERAREGRSVALDTEFVWVRTYYPILGLVQMGLSEEECFLVDAQAVEDMAPLGALLGDTAVVKILHDAPQDLTILRRATGAFPRNIFDTRCAAGFVGLSATLSLRDLLAQLTGVELDKSQSRTDWLSRPLSARQIDYALEDVRYLHRTCEILRRRARQSGRASWLEEELQTYDDPALYAEKEPGDQFQRIKGAGRLAGREVALLRQLAAWREEEARRCDRPRAHVLSDMALVNLACRRPRSRAELEQIKGMGARKTPRYGRAILRCIERGMAAAPEKNPRRSRCSAAAERELKRRVDAALRLVGEKSAALGIDAGLVASRAELRALSGAGARAAPERHRLLRGWRRELLGEQWLGALRGGERGTRARTN